MRGGSPSGNREMPEPQCCPSSPGTFTQEPPRTRDGRGAEGQLGPLRIQPSAQASGLTLAQVETWCPLRGPWDADRQAPGAEGSIPRQPSP